MQQWERLIANDSQGSLNSVSPAFAGTHWKASFMSDLANLNLSSAIVTQHYYPGGPGQADNFLLLDTSSTFGPYHLTSYINSAHAAGKTWYADELNSIYSGGQAGLSDTFSAALWAIDIAFEFAQDGADGVNWHIDNGGPTAFFSVTETQDPTTQLTDYTLNHVYPLYYGVQMLAAATASHGALLPVTLSTSANVKVWALQGEDGLVRVVVLNKTPSTSGSVSVTLPGYSTGEVVRLLAPSYLSTSGVTLGGQTYDGTADGTIRGTAVTTAVTGSNGAFVLNMPAASAALITLSNAAVSLSATSLSFGTVSVGSGSASQNVTLTNTGGSTLTITSIAVTGTDASSFVFANSCGSSLAAGANCTIHGHFGPTTTGALTAAITITDSAIGSPQIVSLSGTGTTPPAVSLSPTSLSFGAQYVGTNSASQTVTMTNTSGSTITITSIAVTGTDASSFVFANSCGSSLAAGANCTIHGHFGPTTTGALTASITISDSAIGSPQSISSGGTGSTP
jgi:hypothetical protein